MILLLHHRSHFAHKQLLWLQGLIESHNTYPNLGTEKQMHCFPKSGLVARCYNHPIRCSVSRQLQILFLSLCIHCIGPFKIYCFHDISKSVMVFNSIWVSCGEILYLSIANDSDLDIFPGFSGGSLACCLIWTQTPSFCMSET